ncbi:MAG: B12-binding domain-containing radical SAM protein [Candidatus Helarchaeota archaeon]|nr:B12-binding domain-containing radical SAM protein [Candidatus Helarchaeota archaeon]
MLTLTDVVNEKGQEVEYLIPQILVPPLGLLYIGQILSDNGYNVKVYDHTVTGDSNSTIMKLIKKLDPKIVGFSMMVDNIWTTIDLMKRLKSWNPNITTVAGHILASFFPEKMMKEIDFDFCVRGEGEYTFLNLVDYLFKKKTDFKEIKGIAYRENGTIKTTSLPEQVKNIDELPIPDRKLIDFNYGLSHKSTSMMTSRGCPFKCRFCVNSIVMGKAWRPRSAKNVVEEIKLLKDEGYKDIFFIDDNMTLSKKRTFQICAGIKRDQLDDIQYTGNCRVDNVSLTLFRALVSCNFKEILFGLESGVQRILDYYKKGITVSQIEQAIKTAKKSGLEIIFGSFVFGAPDETYTEALQTLKLALKLKLHYMVLQILVVIPMSPIYQELVDKKLYTPREDDWKRVFNVPEICPTAIPMEKLVRIIDEGFIHSFKKRGLIKYIFDALKNTYYLDNVINSIRNLT